MRRRKRDQAQAALSLRLAIHGHLRSWGSPPKGGRVCGTGSRTSSSFPLDRSLAAVVADEKAYRLNYKAPQVARALASAGHITVEEARFLGGLTHRADQ